MKKNIVHSLHYKSLHAIDTNTWFVRYSSGRYNDCFWKFRPYTIPLAEHSGTAPLFQHGATGEARQRTVWEEIRFANKFSVLKFYRIGYLIYKLRLILMHSNDQHPSVIYGYTRLRMDDCGPCFDPVKTVVS